MLKVVELAFCGYAVTDLARARALYQGVLGLTPTTVAEGKWRRLRGRRARRVANDAGRGVCCRCSPMNLRCLARVLADVHPRHRMTPQKPALERTDEFASRRKNPDRDLDLCALDCVGEVAGVGDFDEVPRQSLEIHTPSGPCRVLSLEALIRAKEAMGRTQDKLALLQLKAIKEKLSARGPSAHQPW